MEKMDTTTNIIFRALTAIYDGTISGSSLYPNLYFSENKKTNTYYGFRLQEVIPTRLIVRIYTEGKRTVTDLLWLVDDVKVSSKGRILFEQKSKKIEVKGSPKEFSDILNKDATISACYSDLIVLPDFFNSAFIGTPDSFSPKHESDSMLNITKIPTRIFGFSRSILDSKKLDDESYQDTVINSYLALIDLIHRSLEVFSKYSQQENGDIVFCVRCGQDLPANSFYCPICGSKQN